MGRSGVVVGVCLVVAATGCGESSRGVERVTRGGAGGDGGSSGAGAGRGGSTGGGSSGSAGTGSSLAGTAGGVVTGGAGGSDSGGGGAGGSGALSGGSPGEFFVEGRVDGELVRIETGVHAYWFQGLLPGYLSVEARTDEVGWVIGAQNYDGAFGCGSASIALVHYDGDDTTYDLSNPGGCELLVERAAPNVGDVITGTFSGELRPLPGDPNAIVVVTEGAFRAPRVADATPP